MVAELARSYPAEEHGVRAFLQALQRNHHLHICYPQPDSLPFLQGQFCQVSLHSCSLFLLPEGMENEETTWRLRAQRALTFHLKAGLEFMLLLASTVLCSLLAVHGRRGRGSQIPKAFKVLSCLEREPTSSCQAAMLVASSIASERWSEGLCVVYPVRTFPSMISLGS